MIQSLESLRENIEKTLENLEYGEQPYELYEPIRYIMGLGGKRLRPLLTLMSYQLFSEDVETIYRQAASVEIFHNFTLVHDDIMDNAPIRRGQPSVHEKWNRNIGILSGDVMLVKVYDFLVESEKGDLKELLTHFNQCAAEVCEGQQLDMNFEQRMDVTEQEYIGMIRQKTAVLLGFALELGALLADEKESGEHLREFGIDIGIGFQLKDDILDVFGDGSKVGKQVGGDIISRKKTFLTIRALAEAKGKDLTILKDHYSGTKSVDPKKVVQQVTDIYLKYGVREMAEEEMNRYFEEGFKHLKHVEGSIKTKAALRRFTEQLIDRES